MIHHLASTADRPRAMNVEEVATVDVVADATVTAEVAVDAMAIVGVNSLAITAGSSDISLATAGRQGAVQKATVPMELELELERVLKMVQHRQTKMQIFQGWTMHLFVVHRVGMNLGSELCRMGRR